MGDIDDLMAGLDAPMPLPADLRDRLLGALGGDEEPLLLGVDAPHPLTRELKARLSQQLLAKPRYAWVRPVLAIAAAVVLVTGAIAVALQGAPASRRSTSATALAPSRPAGTPQAASSGATSSAAGSGAALPGVPSATGGAAANAPVALPAAGASPDMAAASGSTGALSASVAPAIVAVIGGDAGEQEAFNAYVAALDKTAARHIDIVNGPSARAIVTVNLSEEPLTVQPTGPVLETLDAGEAVAHTPVFDAASLAVHQADLAVSATFPQASPGSTALVVRGTSGSWATTIPAAYVSALKAKSVGVTVLPLTATLVLPSSDAIFIALDTADAKSFFTAHTGLHPRLGVMGISSLVEPSLAPILPTGTRAIGAYDIAPDSVESALAGAIGGVPGMAEVHGWVTAELVAQALDNAYVTTPATMTEALQHMVGFSSGFAPPLAFRTGTTTRTPDGVLYTSSAGRFETNGTFLTDP